MLCWVSTTAKHSVWPGKDTETTGIWNLFLCVNSQEKNMLFYANSNADSESTIWLLHTKYSLLATLWNELIRYLLIEIYYPGLLSNKGK